MNSSAPPPRRALSLTLKMPCATLAEVRARYGESLRRGCFFVRTGKPRAAGTLVRLDAQLSDGSACFRAAATVARVVETPEPEPGMELQLLALDEPGRALLAELGGPKLKALKLDSFSSPPPSPTPPAAASPSSPGLIAASSAGISASSLGLAGSSPGAASGPALASSAPKKDLPEAAKEEPAEAAKEVPAAAAKEARADAKKEAPAAAKIDAPAPAKQLGLVLGIDLGTSNVCVAVVRDGKPRVIASREGHNTIPAVVALGENGKLLVGHPAKKRQLLNPQSTIYGAKRLLGRAFDSAGVREVAGRVPYLVVASERGDAAVQLGFQRLTMQELSGMVLAEAKALAEKECGAEVSRAVITIPARYSERQREAVREAAILAGLHVERLLSEPTAAALAFAHGKKLEKRLMVYDLGGGTFDVSLLELRGNVYEVLATAGDPFLGGIDFDRAIVEHLLTSFREQHGVDFPSDRPALQRLNDAAERAKIALSEQLEVRIREPFIATVDGKPLELDVSLSRTELVLLTGHLVDKTLAICREVMMAKGFTSKDLNEVLLVGGQSRMPWVRERIRNLFGVEPSKAVHPDEAVALGAALFANELETGAIDGAVLIDVLPVSLGYAAPGGLYEELIGRNSPLPIRRTFAPRVTTADSTALALALFENEGAALELAEYLGTVAVSGFAPSARGSTPVKLELQLDAESRLLVSASESASGRALESIFKQSETAEEARRRSNAELPFDRPAEKIGAAAGLSEALAAIPSSDSVAMPNIDMPNIGRQKIGTPNIGTANIDTANIAGNGKLPAEARGEAPAAANPAPEATQTPEPRKGWLRGIFGKKK